MGSFAKSAILNMLKQLLGKVSEKERGCHKQIFIFICLFYCKQKNAPVCMFYYVLFELLYIVVLINNFSMYTNSLNNYILFVFFHIKLISFTDLYYIMFKNHQDDQEYYG